MSSPPTCGRTRVRSTWPLVGAVLMIVGTIVWAGIFVAPFLPLSLAARGLVAGGFYLVGQLIFWLGAMLAGPSAVRRVLTWAPWFLRLLGRLRSPRALELEATSRREPFRSSSSTFVRR